MAGDAPGSAPWRPGSKQTGTDRSAHSRSGRSLGQRSVSDRMPEASSSDVPCVKTVNIEVCCGSSRVSRRQLEWRSRHAHLAARTVPKHDQLPTSLQVTGINVCLNKAPLSQHPRPLAGRASRRSVRRKPHVLVDAQNCWKKRECRRACWGSSPRRKNRCCRGRLPRARLAEVECVERDLLMKP